MIGTTIIEGKSSTTKSFFLSKSSMPIASIKTPPVELILLIIDGDKNSLENDAEKVIAL